VVPNPGARGVTLFEAELDPEVPLAFVAVAVNVYAVEFVSPVKVYDVLDVVCVDVEGLDIIEY
jgi:hypothetical protein